MEITLDDSDPEQLLKDIKQILANSEVNYDEECFKLSKLTGGTSNTIYCVDISTSEKLLFKIYGEGSEQFIDRRQEIENMKLLAKHSLGADVVAEFCNGICYRYINGDSIHHADVIDPGISSLIASKMAQMHQIPVESEECVLWTRISQFISLVPEFDHIYVDGLLERKQDLVSELEFLKSLLENCCSPLVLCHNDLNLPNILYNDSDKTVHFIDVEYAGCNYAAFDIANHFVEFVEFHDVRNPKLDFVKYFPSKDFQMEWLCKYYAAMNQDKAVEELDEMYVLVQKFVLSSHLMWGAWSLVQAKLSKIDFNFEVFAQQRLQEYARMKTIVI